MSRWHLLDVERTTHLIVRRYYNINVHLILFLTQWHEVLIGHGITQDLGLAASELGHEWWWRETACAVQVGIALEIDKQIRLFVFATAVFTRRVVHDNYLFINFTV